MGNIIPKPKAGEYAPYAIMYIDLVTEDGTVIAQLQKNFTAMKALVSSLPEEKLGIPCGAGEWTVKEILIHIMDTERIMTYRALRFSRNDDTKLAGFDQDSYIANSGANERSLSDILTEYAAIRQITLFFFKHLDEGMLTRAGIANGNKMSVRAAAWFIAGHELHHLNSIREHYVS
jgi:uncharacterized damage-inducible protein DinB